MRVRPWTLSEDRLQVIAVYKCGEFIDLCRGPHLPHSGHIRAISLLRTSSADSEGVRFSELNQFPVKELLRLTRAGGHVSGAWNFLPEGQAPQGGTLQPVARAAHLPYGFLISTNFITFADAPPVFAVAAFT
jgi:hypothetical protein